MKLLNFLISTIFSFSVLSSFAFDIFNSSNNQISIPYVQVGTSTYKDVTVELGNVISAVGGRPASSCDLYNQNSNVLNIPQVVSSGNSYNNVVVTVGKVLSAAVQPTNYLYVSNASTNDIAGFTLNSCTGQLTKISIFPVQSCLSPYKLSVYKNKFLFVTCFRGGNGNTSIYQYSINSSDGSISLFSTYSAVGQSSSVVFDSTAQFIYVSNPGSNQISAYSINTLTGYLTQIPGSPFSTDESPMALVAEPSGKFLYAANSKGTVSGFVINSITGNLVPITGSPFLAGVNPNSIATAKTTSGNYIYVTNQNGQSISGYSINPTSGTLAPILGSPFKANAPIGIYIEPSNKYLYVTNYNNNFAIYNSISGYSINPNSGALLPIVSSPYPVGNNPIALSGDPLGFYVFVTNSGDNNLFTFSINASDGGLSQLPSVTFTNGTPNALTLTNF